MPTSEEVSTLEKVFEPLSVLTDVLSGEESVTGSAVRHKLKHVLDTCKADHKDEPLVAEMKSAIVGDLANCYDSPVISTLLDKCCFLDPRFKTNYIMGDKKLELEVSKSSTCTSLADDNFPMAMEPEVENEVSPSPVKKANCWKSC